MIEAEPAEDDDNEEEDGQLHEYTDLLAVSVNEGFAAQGME